MLRTIRQKAATDAGMDVQDVNLKDANDVVLMQDFTDLDGHNIAHDDTLYMFFRIHVEDLDGQKYTYDLTPDTTFSELRDMISSDTGLAKDQINLKKKENGVTTGTDNSVTLDGYSIEHDDTLIMFYTIYVKDLDGTKYKFDVTPTTTVDELKELIKDDLAVDKGTTG